MSRFIYYALSCLIDVIIVDSFKRVKRYKFLKNVLFDEIYVGVCMYRFYTFSVYYSSTLFKIYRYRELSNKFMQISFWMFKNEHRSDRNHFF